MDPVGQNLSWCHFPVPRACPQLWLCPGDLHKPGCAHRGALMPSNSMFALGILGRVLDKQGCQVGF